MIKEYLYVDLLLYFKLIFSLDFSDKKYFLDTVEIKPNYKCNDKKVPKFLKLHNYIIVQLSITIFKCVTLKLSEKC